MRFIRSCGPPELLGDPQSQRGAFPTWPNQGTCAAHQFHRLFVIAVFGEAPGSEQRSSDVAIGVEGRLGKFAAQRRVSRCHCMARSCHEVGCLERRTASNVPDNTRQLTSGVDLSLRGTSSICQEPVQAHLGQLAAARPNQLAIQRVRHVDGPPLIGVHLHEFLALQGFERPLTHDCCEQAVRQTPADGQEFERLDLDVVKRGTPGQHDLLQERRRGHSCGETPGTCMCCERTAADRRLHEFTREQRIAACCLHQHVSRTAIERAANRGLDHVDERDVVETSHLDGVHARIVTDTFAGARQC